MRRFSSPILNAVAYPPTMLFVPVELAGMNAAINAVLMLVGTASFEIPPFIWLFTGIGIHIFLIGVTSRDAHIVSVLKATGMARRKSTNIVPSRGVKYVP